MNVRTLLYRDYVTMRGGRRARRRAGNFSPHVFRSRGKHGEIERKFTNATTAVFSRTIHERGSRTRLRRVLYERDTFIIYVRDYEVPLTNDPRTWFTFATTRGGFHEGAMFVITNATTYPSELNVNYELRSPFNLHERGLGTERFTNVELAVTTARSRGMTLFYHSFYGSRVGGWMFFRISPWEGFTAKTHVVATRSHERGDRFTNALRSRDTVFYVQFLNRGGRFTNALRSHERGVMGYGVP